MKKVKEADKLVDEIFDEGFETYSKLKAAEKELNRMLECMGPMMDQEFVDSEFDEGPAKEEDPQKKQNIINTVPNQDIGNLYMTVRKQMSEFKKLSEDDKAAYKEFFNKMLKKYGVNSPAELSPDKKKEFFNAVDAGWKGKNEQVIRRPQGSPTGGFGSIGGKSTSGGFGSISGKPINREENDEDEGEDDDTPLKKDLEKGAEYSEEGVRNAYQRTMINWARSQRDAILLKYRECIKKAGTGGSASLVCAKNRDFSLKRLNKDIAKRKAKLASRGAKAPEPVSTTEQDANECASIARESEKLKLAMENLKKRAKEAGCIK